ncbi:MAG TPA: alpha/beta fold hydrolase [Thermoanaerobaculia bacterium]
MSPAHCFRSLLILAFVLARPLLAADPPQPAPSSKLQPCEIDGVAGEVRCGTYAVWEDRAAKKGRKIDLYVVVLPALGPERAPDSVVFLTGGPGEGAAELASAFAPWKELRQKRDLVLVDSRGTGRSNPLRCDLYGNATVQEIADHLLPPERVRRCRAELEKKADLRFYGTSLAMADLDEVLAWLGYEKVNVLAGSYGTKAAQVYLRHHSGRVRAAVLSGIAPVDDPAPLLYARVGQRAVDLLLADCTADKVCQTAFPNVREELRAVMERIDQGVKVSVKDPRDGKTYEVRPNRGLVAEGIRYLLYSDMARYVPYLVHRAFQGDLTPLVSVSLGRRAGIDQAIAVGMFLSVTCSEEVPFIDPGVVGKETEGTLLRDFRVREQKRACELWPRGSVPAEDRDLVRTEVPVLLISGERDPVTPPDFGERVASRMPNALHVVMPRGAHLGGPCGESLTAAFIERGSAQGLDLSCVKAPPPAAFATEPPPDME